MKPMRKLLKFIALLWAVLCVIAVAASPATAHKHKKKHPQQTEQVQQATTPTAEVQSPRPAAAPANPSEATEPEEDRSKMSTMERLLDWLGRLHPVIVHFPIAFFPAALFTAIVGRRRPAFAVPVQFLVVAGGVIAPIAALLGWFDGGFDLASDDWLLHWHRWMGTGMGIGGLAMAIWALRRPEAVRGNGMIVCLAIVTAVIIAQGWFGGAMVHGIDHMNW